MIVFLCSTVSLIVLFLLLYVEQEPSQIPPAEAGPSQARQLKGQGLCPLWSSCVLCLSIYLIHSLY